ncbi:vacuolar protein sorting-associated protein 35B-like isoform X1 [Gossypium australe]|uniref:Vacuolar protein sorting-associated protein 35B-like isoform X1 n=1 Tax=Gossypium australe TaxID=47621 RepID=A0A5B6WZI1_9ROSI|nr:vacuolar protein sorting-associated protein 35B-like isoform X1 [Gossypium australe]
MDAVEFILENFTEMNKLWVRMQLETSIPIFVLQRLGRVREKPEKERSALQELIEGVDLEIYKETVLPRVLEQFMCSLMSITCRLLRSKTPSCRCTTHSPDLRRNPSPRFPPKIPKQLVSLAAVTPTDFAATGLGPLLSFRSTNIQACLTW